MKKLLILALLAYAVPAAAAEELFTPAEKQKMMALTLETFWGKAVDAEGKPIEPKNDVERKTIPITQEQGFYIIDKGAESGMAEWCKAGWEERFTLIMEQQRKHFTSDVQIAYAGVLHGMAQAMMQKSLGKEVCDDETKKQVTALIETDVMNLKKSLASQ